jgi:hypothetical protein
MLTTHTHAEQLKRLVRWVKRKKRQTFSRCGGSGASVNYRTTCVREGALARLQNPSRSTPIRRLARSEPTTTLTDSLDSARSSTRERVSELVTVHESRELLTVASVSSGHRVSVSSECRTVKVNTDPPSRSLRANHNTH